MPPGTLREISVFTQQIQKFHSGLKQSGLKDKELAGATCDHYLNLLHHMFQLAIDWEMIEKNPAARVPQFREDNKRERYLSEKELEQLMSVLSSHSNKTIALLILWQLSTGARINESLRAMHSDINYETRQWRIPVSSSKSKRARSVPLNQTADTKRHAPTAQPSIVAVLIVMRRQHQYSLR